MKIYTQGTFTVKECTFLLGTSMLTVFHTTKKAKVNVLCMTNITSIVSAHLLLPSLYHKQYHKK